VPQAAGVCVQRMTTYTQLLQLCTRGCMGRGVEGGVK